MPNHSIMLLLYSAKMWHSNCFICKFEDLAFNNFGRSLKLLVYEPTFHVLYRTVDGINFGGTN